MAKKKATCETKLVRYEILSLFVILLVLVPYIVFLVWNVKSPPMCPCPAS